MRPTSFLVLIALSTLAGSANAQGGSCNDPITITGPGSYPFSTIGATSSGQPAPCNSSGGGSSDIWFKWNNLEASNYTFRVCQADYDVVLALWSSCGGSTLACSDQDGCGQDSFNSVEATIDVTGPGIMIQLDGWNGSEGTGVLEVVQNAGETCSAAVELPSGPINVPFSTIGATSSGQPAPCNSPAGGSSDIWYRWSTGDATNYTFRVCDANFDIVLAVWDGCGWAVLGCSDQDGCGQDSFSTAEVQLDLIPNKEYWIQLDGWNGAQGSGTLEVFSDIGSDFCTSVPNSTGQAALITATGSPSIADNDVLLLASNVPDQPGVFFYGLQDTQLPFGNGGFRCATDSVVRSGVVFASGNTAQLQLNLPAAGITSAGSRYFQFWFRDSAMGPDYFNTTNGTKISFVP